MTIFTTDIDNGIAIISMDDPSQSQNVLTESLAEEFNQTLNEIENNTAVKGLIFTSKKADCFIAGADIHLLKQVNDEQQARELSALLQSITVRISALDITTVVAIHGTCLGGGLELSLAFDYRVVSTAATTKLGFPEVQLGLLPGGSGSQRLPRLIDLPIALDMMLTGRQLNAKRAKKIGLVDAAVRPEILMSVAQKFAAQKKPNRHKPKRTSHWLQRLKNTAPVRKFIFAQARKQTLKASKGLYPAPLKILDVVETGLSQPLPEALNTEAAGFAELLMTAESKHLVNLFFAITELKNDSGVANQTTAKEIEKIGVLGAGLMGAGIAYVTLSKAGLHTRIKDLNAKSLARGVKYIGKILDKKRRRGRLNRQEYDATLGKLSISDDYSGFKSADVVIEAVFEDLALKQSMVADIEALGDDIIFATNTSAIPIDDIAAKAKHPERIIGMHYFSPVEKMPLLEIVRGSKTSDEVTATAVQLGKDQGKTVIVVNDGPGFFTTRILVPYVMEAIRIAQQGAPIKTIDKAIEQFGFPVGPIKLIDEVGIDVGAHIVTTLNQAFGERIPILDSIQHVLDDDRKGRKNARGFYLYDNSKTSGKQVDESIYPLIGAKASNNASNDAAISEEEIIQRCVLTMVNEAAYCLHEGIIRNARDGDIGAIFGLGFPPFLGGPLRYADDLGIDNVIATLESLKSSHGAHFTVSPLLYELKKNQQSFYR